MDPVTIAALAQAAMGIGKGVAGAVQKSKARKLEENLNRPHYRPPAAAREALETSRNAFLDNDALAQLGRRLIEAQAATTAGQIQNTGASANAQLAALSGMQGQNNDALRRLAVQQEGVNADNRNAFLRQLDRMAQYQNQAFQINEQNPFMEGVTAAKDLRSAGNQNIYGGATALGQTVGNLASAQQLGLIGGNTAPAAAPIAQGTWQRPPMPGDPIHNKVGVNNVNPFLNQFAQAMYSPSSLAGGGQGASNFNNNYQKVMGGGQ